MMVDSCKVILSLSMILLAIIDEFFLYNIKVVIKYFVHKYNFSHLGNKSAAED